MVKPTNSQFALQRLTETEWIIHDRSFPPNDARRAVACVNQRDAARADVVWLRELGLPKRYASVAEVLADVARTASRIPIPIPQRPPAHPVTRAS